MKLEGKLQFYKKGIDIYRLDLLPFGGGNKVPRFLEFFNRHAESNTLVAMSDNGAHTFKSLVRFLDAQERNFNIKSMIFLENQLPMTSYQLSVRRNYMNHNKIKVISGKTWQMFLLYHYYGLLKGYRRLGIGGHVKIKEDYFAQIFKSCHKQLKTKDQKIVHILPVSSGDMLEQFLKQSHNKSNISFVGVMTGNKVTRLILKLKFWRYKNLKLVKPLEITEKQYNRMGRKFFYETGISVDPVHTVQVVSYGNRMIMDQNQKVVLWMTQPMNKYFY